MLVINSLINAWWIIVTHNPEVSLLESETGKNNFLILPKTNFM